MPTFTFRGAAGGLLTVSALNESQARRLAMQQAYGKHPDAVTPHAPDYQGQGLTLIPENDDNAEDSPLPPAA